MKVIQLVASAAVVVAVGCSGGTGLIDGDEVSNGDGKGDFSGFVLQASTVKSSGVALALKTNLPAKNSSCQQISGAPCGDEDGDGLADAWEEVVLDKLSPLVRFDESEKILRDSQAGMGSVGRVVPTSSGSGVVVFLTLLYGRDYGNCGFTTHYGDTERVVLYLTYESGSASNVRLSKVYTAAHEGESNDQGRIIAGTSAEISTDPDSGQPRWTVYSSKNKHASYTTATACENASSIPCVQEDCLDTGRSPSNYQWVFPAWNAGEPNGQLLGELSDLGFPGESAWANQDFCGGYNSSNCSSPLVDKLKQIPSGF